MNIAKIRKDLYVTLRSMSTGVSFLGIAVSPYSFGEQAISLALPASFQTTLQTYFENTAFPCGGDAAPGISHALVNASNNLLLYLEIPNYLCNYHMVVEVLVDHKQQWKELSAWEGRLSDVFPTSSGLIALSHWEIEGTYPNLLFRTVGTNWQHIPLPKARYQYCCFEMVNSMSVSNDTLQLQMYKEDSILPFWKLPIKELLTLSSIADGATLPWKLARDIKQQSKPIQSSHWQPLDIHKQSDTLYMLGSRVNQNKAQWLIALPMLTPPE